VTVRLFWRQIGFHVTLTPECSRCTVQQQHFYK
jgi:hypothetical protein